MFRLGSFRTESPATRWLLSLLYSSMTGRGSYQYLITSALPYMAWRSSRSVSRTARSVSRSVCSVVGLEFSSSIHPHFGFFAPFLSVSRGSCNYEILTRKYGDGRMLHIRKDCEPLAAGRVLAMHDDLAVSWHVRRSMDANLYKSFPKGRK